MHRESSRRARMFCAAVAVFGWAVAEMPAGWQAPDTAGRVSAPGAASGVAPGARVMLDAHNAYPYNGRYLDRIDRALATGLPVAIEQDLVWRPAGEGHPARSIVSHGEPYDGKEPSLREYFFARIRPIVEQALKSGDRAGWPLVTLNLDLKSNEPEHHRAIWTLLGEYRVVADHRRTDGRRRPHRTARRQTGTRVNGRSRYAGTHVPRRGTVGGRLRLFGAIPQRPPAVDGMSREESLAKFRAEFVEKLAEKPLPRATNYRRWVNAPWAFVEIGGQARAADWTPEEDTRLRALVRHAHEAGLWIRLWTLNGHAPGEETGSGWTTSYNVGAREAVEQRWRAAIAVRADFIATDRYEAFALVLKARIGERPLR